MDNPRKATDVLLELETMMHNILDLVTALDLTSKINSNKLNEIKARLDKQQKITVEAVQNIPMPPSNLPAGFTHLPAGDPDRVIPFLAENNLPQTDSPQGFRRNSRPETYVDDKTTFPSYEAPAPPPNLPPEIMVPPPSNSNRKSPPPMNPSQNTAPPAPFVAQGQVPVMQRCVDRNGKSIFLADVYLTDLSTNQQVFKTRTNGTGKWMASLAVGNYRVEIRKQGSSLKEKIEAVQDITIDGRAAKLDLPMLIIK
jgi:hypothetical protein